MTLNEEYNDNDEKKIKQKISTTIHTLRIEQIDKSCHVKQFLFNHNKSDLF